MKNIYSMTIATLLAMATLAPRAQADTATFLSKARQVQDLKAAGSLDAAYDLDLQTIGMIRSEIGIDRVVRTIQDRLTMVQDQVVTEHRSSSEFMQGSFSALFGLLSGGGKHDHSLDYDVTTLIVRNPVETAEFSQRVAADRDALSQSLLQYVSSHSTDLTILKVLAMNAFQIIIDKADHGGSTPSSEIEGIIRTAQGLNFLGQQQVTTCVQFNYAHTSRKEKSSTGLNLDIWLIKAQASEKDQNSSQAFAHQETNCESSTHTIQASDSSRVFNVNLSQLDQAVQGWAKAAILKTALSPNDDLEFPTWDSPYYRN